MMMILRPQGLLPERRHKMELAERRRDQRRDPLHGTGMSATEAPTAAARRSPNPAILDAVNITKQFGGLTAVSDVSFTLPEKLDRLDHRAQRRRQDDVLQHADGLLPADARARSRSTGSNITGARPDIVMKAGMARTFQNIRLFSTMTAMENVMIGEHSRMHAGLFGSIFRTPRTRREEREVREKAHAELEYVGIKARWHDQLAINLSYGDQRRVEIARALASDPKVLLLDEPTAGMNPQESAALTDFMHKLRDERGITILLIEHDMKVVMGVSERVTVLDHGEKIAEGLPAEVRAEPARRRGLPRQGGVGGRESGNGVPRSRQHQHLLRQHPGAQGRLADRGRGRVRDADRLQRGRQVHDAALDLRADAAAHRARSSWPARRSRCSRRRRSSGSASASRPRAASASSA